MADHRSTMDRRSFLARAGAAGAAALGSAVLNPDFGSAGQALLKIRLGIIGCGGRGTWIASSRISGD